MKSSALNPKSKDCENQPCSDVSVDRCALVYSRYSKHFLSLGVGAVFHPLYYSKVLIQLGYEPLPLQRSKSYIIFGSDAYFLPNVFKYIRHIKQQDGLTGLYTGVGASLCNNFLGLGVSITVLDYLNEKFPDEILSDEKLKSETSGQAYSRFVKKLSKETASKAIGIIAARPLQVIVIRRMAQFVGGETLYLSTIGSLSTIYQEEGFRGLFSGLVPQLVGEMMILWVTSSLIFAFDRYWRIYYNEPLRIEDDIDDDESIVSVVKPSKTWKQLAHFAIPYVVNGIFYPFQLVSTTMAVNGTSLKVGQMPFIPIFMHWQDCWNYLAKEKQLKRGSKLFMRNYVGPIDYKNGQIYARAPKKWV